MPVWALLPKAAMTEVGATNARRPQLPPAKVATALDTRTSLDHTRHSSPLAACWRCPYFGLAGMGV